MEIKRDHETQFQPVEMDGCSGVKIIRLFVHDGDENWSNVRQFRLEPEGHTAYHRHDWSHQVLVERGILTLEREGDDKELQGGDAVFIEPNERHRFRNTNHYPVHFYCVIPPYTGSL